jgi:hypothetical protein
VIVEGLYLPPIKLNKGQSYTVTVSIPAIYVHSDKAVYVLHVTGFGCEVGMAVLTAINCTGSKRISFTRSTDEFFAVNISSAQRRDIFVQANFRRGNKMMFQVTSLRSSWDQQ